MKKKFKIEGMSCTACAAAIERTTSALDGVDSAVVNFATEDLHVDYNPDQVNTNQIEEAIKKIGYKASLLGEEKQEVEKEDHQISLMRNRMIYSLVFAVPLFYLAMGPMIGLPIPSFLAGEENLLANALTQLLLCLPVLYIGAHFYKDGYKALWYRVPNMDSLIAVGTSAAFFYSIFVFYQLCYAISRMDMTLMHHYAHDLYFESTVTILALISVGKYLEARAKGQTSKQIEKLIELKPEKATVLRDDQPVEIPIEEVVIGDQILIKPGERIPVDGKIIKGETAIDESLLTGESIPVEKTIGSTVSAGTINKNGSVVFEAERIGEDTSLSQIIQLVEEAQSSKAPIAKLADTISRYFVPAVMGIALFCFLLWLLLGYGFSFALSIGISILVISCPCALGLATPTAIMVGTGVGAKLGILFKNGEALESLGKTECLVFDKTGTLTIGEPVVREIKIFNNTSENSLLQLVASLESVSEHPLADAIVSAAKEKNLKLQAISNFEAISGRGILGTVDESALIIGNLEFLKENHVTNLENKEAYANDFADKGMTPLFIAVDGQCAGIIAVADVIKESAKPAIENLEAMGISTYMLTGDNLRTAKAIAKEAGIQNVIAEVLPDQKASIVKNLQTKFKNVTMVGDGINDAPALVQANNGIAIGTGTDVAIESADIILMQNDLEKVPSSIQLSKATLRNIKQNLFWAFIYNVICIPLAAGILYIPFGIKLNAMFAAGAMSLSSVSVVLNALSLRRFKPKVYTNRDFKVKTEAIDAQKLIGVQQPQTETQEHLIVEEMSCNHCVNRVKDTLEAQPDVMSAEVNLDDGEATIICRPGTDLFKLSEELTSIGYPSRPA